MNKKLMIVMMVVGMSALYVRFQVIGMEEGDRIEQARQRAERERAAAVAAAAPGEVEQATEGFSYGFFRPRNGADEEAQNKALELNMGHDSFPAEMREEILSHVPFPPKVMAFLCHKLCTPNTVRTSSTNPVSSIAFSPDGSKFAIGSLDKIVDIWDMMSGQKMQTLRCGGLVDSIAFSPDGKLLAAGSSDGAVGIWNVENWTILETLQHEGRAISVAFSPNGRLLATGSQGEAGIWDIATRQILWTLRHRDRVRSVAFSPNGRLLATGSTDRTAGIWDVATGQRLQTLSCDGGVLSVAFSPDGKLLATSGTGFSGGIVGIWDVASWQRLRTLQYGRYVRSVAFSPSGRLLATGPDRTAVIWGMRSGQRLQIVQCNDDVRSVAFSPDGRLLATGSYTEVVMTRDVNCLERVDSLIQALKTNYAWFELMRAFEETFDYERNEAGEYVYDPQGRKILIRIYPTPEQWATFLTLPQDVQDLLRVRIRNPYEGQVAAGDNPSKRRKVEPTATVAASSGKEEEGKGSDKDSDDDMDEE